MTTDADNDRRLIDLLISHLDQSYSNHQQIPLPPPPTPQRAVPSSEIVSFTIPQILTVLVSVVTIGGTIFAAWNGLTNKMETQKVSTDLIIEQMHKDISVLSSNQKENQNNTNAQFVQTQNNIKELSNRVNELDSTVSQLYNRSTIIKRE